MITPASAGERKNRADRRTQISPSAAIDDNGGFRDATCGGRTAEEGPRIGEYLPGDIDLATRARLQEIVDAEIANLHEGTALRFGIRRSQFEAWVRRREA